MLLAYIENHLQWKGFAVFADRSVTVNFSSEIACAIGFGHTRLPSNHEYIFQQITV